MLVPGDARREGALPEPGAGDDDREPAVRARREARLELRPVERPVRVARRNELGSTADAHHRRARGGLDRHCPVRACPLSHRARMVAVRPRHGRTTFVLTAGTARSATPGRSASGRRSGRGRGRAVTVAREVHDRAAATLRIWRCGRVARRRGRHPSVPTSIPTSARYRAAASAGSCAGIVRSVKRTVPPAGCRKSARAARASAPHSAPVGSCSMRNGGRSGPITGNAVTQRTTSPSGRVRCPAATSPIGDPAARSRSTSAAASSVATAHVASPSLPSSRTPSVARATANAVDDAARA